MDDFAQVTSLDEEVWEIKPKVDKQVSAELISQISAHCSRRLQPEGVNGIVDVCEGFFEEERPLGTVTPAFSGGYCFRLLPSII